MFKKRLKPLQHKAFHCATRVSTLAEKEGFEPLFNVVITAHIAIDTQNLHYINRIDTLMD